MSKLWGGRFSKKTNDLVEEFTKSIHFDQQLAEYDCIGSLCHIDVLRRARLLTAAEYKKLEKGLNRILKSIKKNEFKINDSFEDIHSYIQHLLEKDKSVGRAALKLHTCRSRNDQVILDTKLYCRVNIIVTATLLVKLGHSLFNLATKNKGINIPGYTHLQHAIVIPLFEHFFAYEKMLSRDFDRLWNALKNTHLSLGSGALAGTFIPASKYDQAARALLPKGRGATDSSVDTVSDRDFVIETLSALSIIGMHLSRLAEDMILWASREFDFIEIDDSFCTGSSMMPQKKNPDVLELVRGYTGRLYGNLVNVLVMMKGLPLSYNRDMQHDKEPLFDSFQIVQDELEVLTELFKNVKFKKENIAKQVEDESLYATDIADYLVQNGIPSREAHAIVGKLMQHKYKNAAEITSMDAAALEKFHPLLTPRTIKRIINPETSVASKKSVRRIKQKSGK